MLSKMPIDLDAVSQDDIDAEILRAGIIAEHDAVNLYEQMASKAQDETVKKVMLDVAKEEKTHIGEFQAVLLSLDKEQERELEKGAEEVREMNEKQEYSSGTARSVLIASVITAGIVIVAYMGMSAIKKSS